MRADRHQARRYRWALAALLAACAGPAALAQLDPLPNSVKVDEWRDKYQAERDALVRSGADKKVLTGMLAKAEVMAERAAAARQEGRLLQAQRLYQQARWQLPYLGPEVPDHVARVLGNLRLRHSGGVYDVAYSPDGKYIATASFDRTVKLWDVENGHEAQRFVGHADKVYSISFSPDSKWLASAGGEGKVKLWDVATGKELREVAGKGADASARVVAFSADGQHLVSGWSDKAVLVHEAATGKEVRAITDLPQRVENLAFSPKGDVLAVAAADGQVRLYEYPKMAGNANQPPYWSQQHGDGSTYHVSFSPDGTQLARCGAGGLTVYRTPAPGAPIQANPAIRTIPLPKGENNGPVLFRCSLFSWDGRSLFTGATDGVVRQYDLETGQLAGSFKGHNDFVEDLAMTKNGSELASASLDHSVRLWPFDVVAQSRSFAGQAGPVWMADVSPDGRQVVTGGADKLLRVWEVGTGKLLHTLEGHTAPVTVALFSPDGRTILSAGGDKVLKLWDAATGKENRTLEGHTGTITAADFSADGKQVVSSGVDQTVRVWDAATGKEVKLAGRAPAIVAAVAFHPDGKTVATGQIDQTITLWDVPAGAARETWTAHTAAVSGLAFSPDGKLLASCGADGLVKVWPLNTPGANPEVFSGHAGALSSVAFRPDSKFVVSGGSDQVVKLWNVVKGTSSDPVQEFRGHADWVTSVTFSRDGFYILSASVDGTGRVWEMTTKEIPFLSEHTGLVTTVAVSADGKRLASAASDARIKLWDLATGEEQQTLQGYNASVVSIAYGPDGKLLASSGYDRNASGFEANIYLWDLATGQRLPETALHRQNLHNFLQPPPLLKIWPDGKKLLVWAPADDRHTKVHLVDVETGKLLVEGVDRGRDVQSVNVTADGKKVAIGAADGTVRVYDVEDNFALQPGGDLLVWDNKTACGDLAFSPDGKKLVVGSAGGDLKVFDVAARKELKKIDKAHEGSIYVVAVSPDGKRVATTSPDNVVKLWDLETGAELRRWDVRVPRQLTRSFVQHMAFTPDGRHLVTGNANTTIYVLELP